MDHRHEIKFSNILAYFILFYHFVYLFEILFHTLVKLSYLNEEETHQIFFAYNLKRKRRHITLDEQFPMFNQSTKFFVDILKYFGAVDISRGTVIKQGYRVRNHI